MRRLLHNYMRQLAILLYANHWIVRTSYVLLYRQLSSLEVNAPCWTTALPNHFIFRRHTLTDSGAREATVKITLFILGVLKPSCCIAIIVLCMKWTLFSLPYAQVGCDLQPASVIIATHTAMLGKHSHHLQHPSQGLHVHHSDARVQSAVHVCGDVLCQVSARDSVCGWSHFLRDVLIQHKSIGHCSVLLFKDCIES